MPLTRSARTDRRRRVMREAVAVDASVAVESVRAKQRRKDRDRSDSEDDYLSTAKRDPGYSQAVRRACQQRLVQLIPVRRRSLTLTIFGACVIWSILLLAHYYVHVLPATSSGLLPIAFLLHLRNTHGIAHWLGGQLWMLTALASLMIFQLRKHKLDDYRAKYRVWGFLSVAALFSSFDASSSALYLLGKSIDGWSLREIGYSGWSVVLASFAALVGVLGLRICSEIKSAPLSLLFWLGGLCLWAYSALLGTELILSPWQRSTTDMVVGGAWLGGILSVFLAAGIFLRHTYIQAQKRFILRNGMLAKGKRWQLPRFRRRKLEDLDNQNENSNDDVKQSSSIQREEVHDHLNDKKRSRFGLGLPWKRRWFSLPRWKSDSRLGDDYSDVAAERRKRDEGFDEPLTKKRGWFSKASKARDEHPPQEKSPLTRKSDSTTSKIDPSQNDSMPDFQEIEPQRKSWWKRSTQTKLRETKPESAIQKKPADVKDGNPKKQRWFQKSVKVTAENSEASAKPKVKKSWGLLSKRSSGDVNTIPSKTALDKEQKPKRRLFGLLDSLKLKPPVDATSKAHPTPIPSTRAAIPSSSMAQRNDAAKPSQNYNESAHAQSADEDDYEDDSTRNLSKAERKRLRRQQQENRRAA